MGTELIRACIKEEVEMPLVPPGFESYTSFTLKRVEDKTESTNSCSSSASAFESKPAQIEPDFENSEAAKIKRSLRRRPWINYSRFDTNSEDESDSQPLEKNLALKRRLPKGVIRGCPECINCQKVIARWHPQDSCRPVLEEAPVFYPSEEEFKDTLNYIASIRPKAEPYGICRIVPPASWKPPCPLQKKNMWEGSKFATRIQKVDKLQNRDSMRKSLKINNQHKRKRRRCMRMGIDSGHVVGPVEAGFVEAERFGFEPGPEFTLDAFQKYADDFKSQYFSKSEKSTDSGDSVGWKPSLENIEGEYWRMVEKPTEEIEVLYGADLETGVFGSGFPKGSSQVAEASDEQYIKSGWNLNNFPRLPGSVLSYESGDISGVLVPWLYIGMCFSSFCWHVEDHHLYSLNYMHLGDPKLWYGVPGTDALKLEVAMKKHLPDLFEEQPDLLHKLVTQMSPTILKSEGVPVYRCVQNAGEFVLTFPRAYHSGFNSGFNCAEAVNVAPVDWLPHGQNAIELYREQGRKTSISHDKLLLGAARDAVKANWEINLLRKNTSDNLRWKDVCGKDGILAKALKARVEMERVRREYLCNSSQTMKMDSNFDATDERECSVCLFDLHLSAVGCYCSPDIYACLNHAKHFCSCSWTSKFFLFRYDITELSILVEALEGKLSAIYRWARLDLGLALSSHVSKDGNINTTSKFSQSREANSQFSSTSAKKEAEKDHSLQLDKEGNAVCHLSQEDTSYTQNVILEDIEVGKKPLDGSNIILLSDDEGDDTKEPCLDRAKETSSANWLGHCMVAPSNNRNDQKSWTAKSSLDQERAHYVSPLVCLRGGEDEKKGGTDISTYEGFYKRENDCHNIANGEINEVLGEKVNSSQDNVQSISGNVLTSQNNLDRYFRHKGPRIAKVVRRINSNVEPIKFGTILSRKLWCNSQAIFPKGYRSRVRYISILDPTNMCYYVSEILDAGQDGPLFMVSVENCPNEVFVHVSAGKCWDMVRERVNQEIAKQHKLGKAKLPPLQPPGCLDGLEMFGFTSPTIVQVVEAMDGDRVSTEYWSCRPHAQMLQHSICKESSLNLQSKSKENKNQNSTEASPAPAGLNMTIIRGLFEKANQEELNSLYSFLGDDTPSTTRAFMARLLIEEIQRRSG